ncbi:MAG TPA: ABC transporter substrate-binding protein, partial [Halococcus sp.]|nr:ABC transporter substrate-binding protein [Halococcus sp.]
MPSGNKRRGINRRNALIALGAGGMAGLAGCLGGGDDGNGSNGNNGGGNGNGGGTGSGGDSKNKGDTNKKGLPSHGGDFVNGLQADAADLNVLKIDEGATEDAVANLFDAGWTRTGYKPEQLSPRWFESWDISDSYDVVEIKLRNNLKYSDKWGQLTAEDYIYNVENVWTGGWYPYTYAPNFNVGKNDTPVKFEKTGKYTIREELPEPRPFWPYNDPITYSLPLPKKLLKPYVKKKDAEGLNKDPAVFKSKFSGNLGPWKVKKWNRQSVIVYERNDDYYLRKWAKKDDRIMDIWAEAPYFDTLSLQLFGEETTMRSALKSGQIQEASIAATKVENFKGRDDITLMENPYISYSDYTGMNQRVNGWEGLRSKKVRWAMANLYNRNFVVENILDGKGSTQGTIYPKWGPYYPEEDMKTFEWTVKKAKQLLKEGTSSDYGYSGETFVGPDGDQLELKCVYVQGTIDDLRAQYLKKRLGEAGIKLTLETTNWSNLLKTYAHTDNPAKGASKPIGYGKKGDEHPSTFNYGPW